MGSMQDKKATYQMMQDLFCEDYYISSSQQAINTLKELIKWKLSGNVLYPDDVINIMIHFDLVKKHDYDKLLEELKEKPVDLHLPINYIQE